MEVLKYIGYSVALTSILVAAAIEFYPSRNFTPYIPELLIAGVIVSLAVAVLSFHSQNDLTLHDKNVLMTGMMIAVLVPTAFSVGAFIHEDATSWSDGEIHWHADFEVVVEDSEERLGFTPSDEYNPPETRCMETGEEHLCQLDLIDPQNYCKERSKESTYMCRVNDRVGITEYHEHNDKRIHLEGTFDRREEATLAAFFKTFGGKLTSEEMRIPTNNGVYETRDGDGKTLKVAVKKGVGGERSWEIVNPESYVISPYTRGELLDDIYIIYDSNSSEEVLQDLEKDDSYRGTEFFKKGEGYE